MRCVVNRHMLDETVDGFVRHSIKTCVAFAHSFWVCVRMCVWVSVCVCKCLCLTHKQASDYNADDKNKTKPPRNDHFTATLVHTASKRTNSWIDVWRLSVALSPPISHSHTHTHGSTIASTLSSFVSPHKIVRTGWSSARRCACAVSARSIQKHKFPDKIYHSHAAMSSNLDGIHGSSAHTQQAHWMRSTRIKCKANSVCIVSGTQFFFFFWWTVNDHSE